MKLKLEFEILKKPNFDISLLIKEITLDRKKNIFMNFFST